MQAQGLTRLQDALKNVPGITLNAGEGAARGDTVNLRGFSAFNDFFLDGVRDAAVYNRDSFDLQQVEVIKGPSATLFGRGSTGGVINQVSKAPGLDPSGPSSRTSAAKTSSAPRRHQSAVQPLGGPAQRDGRDPASPTATTSRTGAGASRHAAIGLGGPTTVTLAYLHQQEDNGPTPASRS